MLHNNIQFKCAEMISYQIPHKHRILCGLSYAKTYSQYKFILQLSLTKTLHLFLHTREYLGTSDR